MSEPESDPRPTPQRRLSISRQRLVELTVVVFGVLIALGLENLIQEARYRADAHDLERAFVDDLGIAVVLSLERQSITPCLMQRLRTLSERVDAATGDLVPVEDLRSSTYSGYATPRIYRAPIRSWRTSSFDRALGSEAFKRIPSERAAQYAGLFALIGTQQERNQAEYIAAAGLAPLAYSQPNMSDEVRADALQQIALLDGHQRSLALAGGQIVERAIALPVIGDEIRLSVLDDLRSNAGRVAFRAELKTNYGDCVDLTVIDRVNTPAAS